MTVLNDTWTLGDFQADAHGHIRRLTETGEAEVLTVEGKPVLVVQSADAYKKMAEEAGFARHILALKNGLAQADRGEGSSAEEAFDRIAKKFGFAVKK